MREWGLEDVLPELLHFEVMLRMMSLAARNSTLKVLTSSGVALTESAAFS